MCWDASLPVEARSRWFDRTMVQASLGQRKNCDKPFRNGINLRLSHSFFSKVLPAYLMPLGPPTMEVPGNDGFALLRGLWWDLPGSRCWPMTDLLHCLRKQSLCWMAVLLQGAPQIPMISPASRQIIFSFSKTNSLYLQVYSRMITIMFVGDGAKSNT